MAPYDVGYRKPPKAAQFKKGHSGNPRGRPKGTLNLATDVGAEFGERITVRENGNSRRVSKQRALLKSLMAKALQGDIRAAATLLALRARKTDESLEGQDQGVDDTEKLIMERFAPRVLEALARKKEESR